MASEIVELADVAVHELDAGCPQPGQVQLRAAPAQVVDATTDQSG